MILFTFTSFRIFLLKVVEYVETLLRQGVKQTEIGVIAPYKRQVILIRNKLRDLIDNDDVMTIHKCYKYSRISEVLGLGPLESIS